MMRYQRWLVVLGCLAGAAILTGCERGKRSVPPLQTQPPATTQPSDPPLEPNVPAIPEQPVEPPTEPPPESVPAPVPPSATQPTPKTQPAPETKPAPATKPAPSSFYESSPPYPVKLHILSPRDEQPGWIRVLKFENSAAAAIATGVFPEKNRFIVRTSNVKRLRIEVGSLPLAADRRVFLRIDDQPMELTRRSRERITLELNSIGQWTAVR